MGLPDASRLLRTDDTLTKASIPQSCQIRQCHLKHANEPMEPLEMWEHGPNTVYKLALDMPDDPLRALGGPESTQRRVRIHCHSYCRYQLNLYSKPYGAFKFSGAYLVAEIIAWMWGNSPEGK
ncbi:hypothetical protein PABG_11511 [Paracoccidioides brasiliensis Pb03]|nr:hypothetical protein PABG_11511 [Paracoccidioides brasiliensis Pb03]